MTDSKVQASWRTIALEYCFSSFNVHTDLLEIFCLNANSVSVGMTLKFCISMKFPDNIGASVFRVFPSPQKVVLVSTVLDLKFVSKTPLSEIQENCH